MYIYSHVYFSDDTSQPNFDLYKVIPDYKLDSAKDLLETVGSVLSKSGRSVISLEDNFYTLGGTSLNTLVAVGELRERGYQICTSHFRIINLFPSSYFNLSNFIFC